MAHSRRAFLQQASTATAVGLLARLPASRLWAATPAEFLINTDEALLREVALTALDAARAAGAGFADVRIGTGHEIAVRSSYRRADDTGPRMAPPYLKRRVGYGVRVIVNGAWGFAAGYELTPDGVTRAARAAAARARSTPPHRPRTLALAPASHAGDVRWATSIAQDPLTVPFGEQGERQLAALHAAIAVSGLRHASVEFEWQRTERVFASTDGALQVQHHDFAWPAASVLAQVGGRETIASDSIDAFDKGGYGYEAVARVNLTDELRQVAERAVAKSTALGASRVPAEVGRYDIVVSGGVMARLLARTLVEAANAERALGYRANHEGTSFAAPPDEVLGTLQVAAPLLTVRADRRRPHGAATVGWDDEGVTPEDFTIVQDGVLVDYCTTRETAVELGAWYRARGEAVRSHGCASGAGQQVPGVQLPNLTVEPGGEHTSVDDIIADTKRGFYVEWLGNGGSDQQMLNTQFSTATSSVREIRNGKLGAWVQDLGLQFITPDFWRQLDALGGPGGVTPGLQSTDWYSLRDPLQLPYASVSTVPARFRDVNVLNTGRIA